MKAVNQYNLDSLKEAVLSALPETLSCATGHMNMKLCELGLALANLSSPWKKDRFYERLIKHHSNNVRGNAV